ncbi:response regulator [bacterium AH-315-K03]|nr:response regulator [bacterium AH-315-K03]
MNTPTLKKILLVDDDEDIQEISKIALVNVGGYIVKVCGGGNEALRSLPKFSPDLILLDVMMPEMDGPATLSAIQKNGVYSNIPIIFVTAKVQSYEICALITLGAIDVITKPFDPMTLSQQVAKIWLNHQQLTGY